MEILNTTKLRRKTFWLTVFIVLQISCIATWSADGSGLVPGSWKFAVLCDTRGDNNPLNLDKSGVNEVIVNAIAKDIVKEGAELVIVPGDMVNGYKYINASYFDQFMTWRKAMAPVYAAGIKVYPLRGNHETGPFLNNEQDLWSTKEKNVPAINSIPELKLAFLEAFNDPWIPANGPAGEKGLTYSFSRHNAFFVGVDQYVKPFQVNQTWLDTELQANKLPHIFVYGHNPAFSVSHPDSLAFYPKERDTFWDSLGKAGVKIYFCGHDHYYNRAYVADRAGNSIYQVLSGAGGAPFAKWQPQQYAESDKVVKNYHDEKHYGYVLVTIKDTQVTMEWKALLKEEGTDVWKALDTLHYSLK
jgi:hypothetical protein